MSAGTPVLSASARQDQAVFRALLDAMARPGKVNPLPAQASGAGAAPGILAVMTCLVDHQAAYWISPALGEEVERALSYRTTARRVQAADAGFVAVDGPGAVHAVSRASVGTIEYPDEGATVIISCDSLTRGPVRLTLYGPGVCGAGTLRVAGVPVEAFRTVSRRNRDFPLGIDLILVAADNSAACIPRSNRIEAALMGG